jgi:hypothetical protein
VAVDVVKEIGGGDNVNDDDDEDSYMQLPLLG